jgi:hypothetical protein
MQDRPDDGQCPKVQIGDVICALGTSQLGEPRVLPTKERRSRARLTGQATWVPGVSREQDKGSA